MRVNAHGSVYTAPFSAQVLTTNAQDLFLVTAPSAGRLAINKIVIGQYTEFGDAQAELLSMQMMIGTTSTSTSAGTLITPQNVRQHTGAPTAGFTVAGPSTVLSSTTSAVVRLADVWNVAAGWLHLPMADPSMDERFVLEAGQKMALRMSAPNDAMTLNGTITLQSLGIG
jgi:hypothetical protein